MQILFSKHVFVFYFHIYGKQVLLSKMLMVLLAAVSPFFFFLEEFLEVEDIYDVVQLPPCFESII